MRRAFTLIEMMMSVALTALVFAMIGGILISVISSREGVEEMLRQDKAGYGILGTLRRDLTGVYAYQLSGPAFSGVDHDEGDRPSDSLDFVTTADVAAADASGVKPKLVEVGYRVRKADEGEAFVLYRRATVLQGDPLKGGGAFTAIYQQVRSLDLKYLDAEAKDSGWLDKWDKADALPAAIKVKLELLPEEHERIAAQQEGRQERVPVYEMVVGIPASAKAPKMSQPAAGQQGQQGGQGGTQPAGGAQPGGGGAVPGG
ncbi:MAG: type II secretion system protein J [Planctomycetota bacterium]